MKNKYLNILKITFLSYNLILKVIEGVVDRFSVKVKRAVDYMESTALENCKPVNTFIVKTL